MLQGYDSLLCIDDVEKKALAQPPESRWDWHWSLL